MRKNEWSFYEALSGRESGGNYKIVNTFGYLGRYQMGEKALIDTGYYIEDTTGSDSAHQDFIGQWSGKNGVWSKTDFLNNKIAQDDAVRKFHKKNWNYLKNYHQYVGQTLNGYFITISGMLAGAHLAGWTRMKKFLASGGTNIFHDAYGTSITEYITKFADYDMSSYGTIFNNDNNIFNGGSGVDIFHAGSGNDTINAKDGDDQIFGERGEDLLIGGAGSDVLYGGEDNDTLTGGDASGNDDQMTDILKGGVGDDKYITGNGDIVQDEDGIGSVYFKGTQLTKGVFSEDTLGYTSYRGDGGTYYLIKGTKNLLFVNANGESVTLQQFKNGQLEINLVGGDMPPPPPPPTFTSISNTRAVNNLDFNIHTKVVA